MTPRVLVVATSSSTVNKFEQRSLQSAYNLRDYLEQTGDYADVSIFQMRGVDGGREWVKLVELEC